MLQQGEFTLTEIAYKMNYSSVAHLSFQFEKINQPLKEDQLLPFHFLKKS